MSLDDILDDKIEDPRDWSKPSRAIVARTKNTAIVLWHVGPHIEEQINQTGTHDVDDLGFTEEPPEGISMWEGKMVGGTYCPASGDYDDVDLKGSFRALTDDEWTAIREARCPWNENDWLLTKGTP